MARYTADSKERVRDAVDMIDLVSARTELRRAGANRYQGLCPFHEERTPSFGIDPLKKVYHCFGCGAGGDVFTFVAETEGLDFTGALELLADRYGVELQAEEEDPQATARRRRRERLYALLDRTAGYYARYLWEAREAADAREYLAGRGLQEDMLRRFRVGYSPSAWDHMYVRCRSADFSDDELFAAGLTQRSRERGTPYDRFRGRLMFPLCDLRGRVLGFGARQLGEGRGPKYLNTAEGELYHKGRQLFGADLARPETAKAASVVVVEGYTDVLALHQAGIGNAVGLMGTAMTAEQVSELARMVGPEGTVHLALDADASGHEAMRRAAEHGRLRLRIVEMPPGTDPADLVRAEGAEAMRARVDASIPFDRFRVDEVLRGAGDSAEARTRAFEALRPILSAMAPSPEREDLRMHAASRLELPEDLAALLTVSPSPAGAPAEAPARRAFQRREEPERTFLALCIAVPEAGRDALRKVDLDAHFTSPVLRRAAAHLREHLPRPLENVPEGDGELQSLLAELALRADREPADRSTLEVQALQLETARLEREIAAARAEGRLDVSDLAARRQQVKARMDEVMADL
jgi:DNA primase